MQTRVALVAHDRSPPEVDRLLEELPSLGYTGTRVGGSTGPRVAQRLLDRRGFDRGLAGIPSTLGALRRADCGLAHAFSAIDACTALLWARRSGRPVVLTLVDPPERATLVQRRLDLRLLAESIERVDALVVTSDEAVDAGRRWLARRPVLAPDGAAVAAVYRSLL